MVWRTRKRFYNGQFGQQLILNEECSITSAGDRHLGHPTLQVGRHLGRVLWRVCVKFLFVSNNWSFSVSSKCLPNQIECMSKHFITISGSKWSRDFPLKMASLTGITIFSGTLTIAVMAINFVDHTILIN